MSHFWNILIGCFFKCYIAMIKCNFSLDQERYMFLKNCVFWALRKYSELNGNVRKTFLEQILVSKGVVWPLITFSFRNLSWNLKKLSWKLTNWMFSPKTKSSSVFYCCKSHRRMHFTWKCCSVQRRVFTAVWCPFDYFMAKISAFTLTAHIWLSRFTANSFLRL